MTPEDYPEYCNVKLMTPPHPPQEYIITEDELRKVILPKYHQAICDKVRSRTSPAPAQIKLRMPEDLEEFWLREHDAAIRAEAARQARSELLDILDDLRKYANGEYQEADVSDNEREMRIHLEYENRIWGIMKSLRQDPAQ